MKDSSEDRGEALEAMLEALLEIVACPEDHQPLSLAPEPLVAHFNELIEAKSLRSLGGDLVSAPMQAGLLRADEARVYPVRDGHAVMLPEEAIVVRAEDRVWIGQR